MIRTTCLAAFAACLFPHAQAWAQDATDAPGPLERVPAGPDTPPDTPEGGGVLSYAPEFFASSNPVTALDMVQRLPGFSIEDGDDDVRGLAGSEGNIMINGARPASKSDSPSDVLARTPASRVIRIDLVRGGAPGIDMQGQSVIANVILSEESSRQHTVSARTIIFEGGPTMPNGRYEFSASEGQRSWGARVGRSYGYDDSTGFGSLVRTGPDGAVVLLEDLTTGMEGGGWNGGADWAGPLGPGRAEFTASASDDYFQDFSIFESPADLRRFDSRHDDRSAEFGARYELPVSDSVDLIGRVVQNLGTSEGVASSRVAGVSQRFVFDNETSESVGRTELRWRKTPNLTLESTAEVAYNVLDASQSFAIDGVDVSLPGASVKVEELRGEASARALWQARDNLTLEGALRLEQSTISQSGDSENERSFFYPKPRLALTWTPAENNQIRLRFEREVGQLDFNDFAASSSLSDDEVFGGNADLQPEQRWISEFVYERRFWGEGALTLTLRHDEIVDVIDTVPLDGGLSAVGNIGGGTLDRARLDLRVPTDRFGVANGRLTLELPLDHTRVTDPTTGERRKISGVRPFRPTLKFEHDLPRYNLTWSLFWLPYYLNPNYQPDQYTYFTVHNYVEGSIEYTISPGFTFGIEATIWNDFRVGRDVYADRLTQAIDYRERRRTDPRDFIQLRLRKQF